MIRMAQRALDLKNYTLSNTVSMGISGQLGFKVSIEVGDNAVIHMETVDERTLVEELQEEIFHPTITLHSDQPYCEGLVLLSGRSEFEVKSEVFEVQDAAMGFREYERVMVNEKGDLVRLICDAMHQDDNPDLTNMTVMETIPKFSYQELRQPEEILDSIEPIEYLLTVHELRKRKRNRSKRDKDKTAGTEEDTTKTV